MELTLSRSAGGAIDPAWAGSKGFEVLEPRVLLSTTDPDNTVVKFVTEYGAIVVELYDDLAPITVDNFLNYLTRGDYDGTIIHRSIPGFVVQGGGFVFNGDDTPKLIDTDPEIQLEYNLPNLERTIAMARQSAPNSASSQFYFNLTDNASLDKPQNPDGYAVFGKVVGGWNVVLTIAGLPTANLGSPFTDTPVTDAFNPQSNDAPPDEAYVHVQKATVLGTVGEYMQFSAGTILSSDINDARSITVAGPNVDGSQTVYQWRPGGGGWYVSALAVKNPRPDGISTETFIDPKNGTTYAAVATDTGLLLYKNTNFLNGGWMVRNLSLEVGGSLPNITSVMTSFSSPTNGKMYLAGLATNGDLILFEQTGGKDSGGSYVWKARNVTTTDMAALGATMPDFSGLITSYTAPWNGLNITGVDNNGDLQSIWWAPNFDTRPNMWRTSNLTEITGGQALVGRASSWVTSWNAINLAGTTASGDLVTTWWDPNTDVWQTTNLTALTDGPKLVNNTIDSYFKGWGGQNIVGIAAGSGNVVVYWWAPEAGNQEWQVANLTGRVGTTEMPVGAISAASALWGDTNLFYTTKNEDVVRIYWKADNNRWSFNNLTRHAEFI